ncbi:MAG: hypothetical protein ACD_51C00365G0001 [uncultured bacterium]|nr:MAG: hypothetical protein ACD_51C00365G0001 [uncultured bacterium]
MGQTKPAWDGVERRGNQIPGRSAVNIADRALEEGNGVEDMFRGADKPEDRNVRAEDIADLNLRRQVEGVLSASQVDYSEIGQLVTKLVDEQYANRLGKLKARGLYNPEQPKEGDVPPPTPDQTKDILKKQLTPDQSEVIKGMKKPVLQLVPVTSMARYVESMNAHKPMSGQIDAYVSEWSKGALQRADVRDGVVGDNTIVGWRIAVTEGEKEPEVLKGDNLGKTLRQRDAWFKQEYGKKGASGVDLKRMLLLEQDSLEDGEPINDYVKQDGTWTFVNEEPENNGGVAGVGWSGSARRVVLAEDLADILYNGARVRASVVVDVPRA